MNNIFNLDTDFSTERSNTVVVLDPHCENKVIIEKYQRYTSWLEVNNLDNNRNNFDTFESN